MTTRKKSVEALRLWLCRAQLRTSKTLEQFDLGRLPKLNRALVHDLATGRCLHERAPVLLAGPAASASATWRRPGALRGTPGRGRHLHRLLGPHAKTELRPRDRRVRPQARRAGARAAAHH